MYQLILDIFLVYFHSLDLELGVRIIFKIYIFSKLYRFSKAAPANMQNTLYTTVTCIISKVAGI